MGRRAAYVRGTAEERFWPKVNKNGPVPPHRPELGQCWLWTAAENGHGYGAFSIAPGTQRPAHRVAWEITHGRRLARAEACCHRCDTRLCVRPEHLFVGSLAANNEDMARKGRAAWQKPRPPRPPCSCPGCVAEALFKGMCQRHYNQWRHRRAPVRPCSVQGCQRNAHAGGWCVTHWRFFTGRTKRMRASV